jgi:hypothetical protein
LALASAKVSRAEELKAKREAARFAEEKRLKVAGVDLGAQVGSRDDSRG